VVVAVVAVRVVEMVFDQVVRVSSVRDGLVTTVRPVAVLGVVPVAVVFGRAGLRMLGVYDDAMLVDVPLVGMMEMAVVQVVDVPVVDDGGVAAAGTVLVIMRRVRLVLTHLLPLVENARTISAQSCR
jgi:hypothetical protein